MFNKIVACVGVDQNLLGYKSSKEKFGDILEVLH